MFHQIDKHFHRPFSICLLLMSFGVSLIEAEKDKILDSLKVCKDPLNGKDGVCINLEREIIRCPSLRETLLENNFTDIYVAVCGEPDLDKLNETRVCCPVEEYIELYPKVKHPFRDHVNFKLIPSPENSNCGESLSNFGDRIIGGSNVLPGSQPWMARLGIEIGDDKQIRFLCSASILNHKYLLSASHCLKHGILRKIRLAEYDEDQPEECIESVAGNICQGVEDYEPEQILIHENYTGKIGSLNDIALIRLKEPIRNLSSLFTRPVCLPFVDEFELPDLENEALLATGSRNALSVQGWGKENNDDHEGTKQLKQVNVPLRSNVFCRHFFRKANLTVTDQQICVGGAKDKGSCAGDSGSPLLLSTQTLNRMGMRNFQIGIVSYGSQKCGQENSPVVYTRVRSFLKWILDSIRE